MMGTRGSNLSSSGCVPDGVDVVGGFNFLWRTCSAVPCMVVQIAAHDLSLYFLLLYQPRGLCMQTHQSSCCD